MLGSCYAGGGIMRWKLVVIVVLFWGFSSIVFAQPPGPGEHIEPTMEKMEVYMLAVSLVRDDGAQVQIFSGEKAINPIGTNPGDVIGEIVRNYPVPPGTYTSIQVTMSRLNTMKMYLEIPSIGRLMQTTTNGIQQSFSPDPEIDPPDPLDPAEYGEFRFIMPEDPDAGMGPDAMEPAGDVTPSDAGSFTKSSPPGAFTVIVEEGKTTEILMGVGSGAPDQGYDETGDGGEFKNPTKDSDFRGGQPQPMEE